MKEVVRVYTGLKIQFDESKDFETIDDAIAFLVQKREQEQPITNIVTVIKGRFSDKSKCSVKSCRRADKYLVFGWDGKPMLSRLEAAVCGKHLDYVIGKILKRAEIDSNIYKRSRFELLNFNRKDKNGSNNS